MGKRSSFERNPRDFYRTPPEAVLPLLPHLAHTPEGAQFIEPCAGDGALKDALQAHGHDCLFSCDIEPGRSDVVRQDVFGARFPENTLFITNPPWDRTVLHPLIGHLLQFGGAWLLFDADWAHTIQSRPYMPWCRKIVSVGRVKWIAGSKQTGKDNCCWYYFDRRVGGPTVFFGR